MATVHIITKIFGFVVCKQKIAHKHPQLLRWIINLVPNEVPEARWHGLPKAQVESLGAQFQKSFFQHLCPSMISVQWRSFERYICWNPSLFLRNGHLQGGEGGVACGRGTKERTAAGVALWLESYPRVIVVWHSGVTVRPLWSFRTSCALC